jgi:hypothetical protein
MVIYLVRVNRMPFSRTNLILKAFKVSGILDVFFFRALASFLLSFKGDILLPLPLPLLPICLVAFFVNEALASPQSWEKL